VVYSSGLVNVQSDYWKTKLDKLKQELGLRAQQDLSFLGCGVMLNVYSWR